MKITLKYIAIPLLISFVLLEGVLQVILAYKDTSFFPWNDDVWERHFIRQYEQGTLIYSALHEPHETRGWTPIPNQSKDIAGYHYTTNNMGHRSVHDYQYDASKYTVLIVGDSFTFGINQNNGDEWPSRLESIDGRSQIINLAVGGYGIDQMYITLRESIEMYKPQLVIVAYIDDNLKRSLLSFRHYKKPRFVLRNGDLELTNTPIKGLKDVLEEVKKKHSGFNLALPEVLDRVFGLRWERCFEVNSRIIEEMIKISKRENADLLFVHLAWSNTMKQQNAVDQGEVFIREFIRSHEIYSIMTREHLSTRKLEWASEHYNSAEAKAVAHIVYEKITELPSWREFPERGDSKNRH